MAAEKSRHRLLAQASTIARFGWKEANKCKKARLSARRFFASKDKNWNQA
jgi:hypothetical protein